MMFEYAEEIERLANIKVTGVGGAGGNAVGRMIAAGLSGVEFLAMNTDLQALKDSRAHHAMQIGAQLTKGLGSGGDPSRGRAAAEEDRDSIASALAGADMVFVTAGMGGGTGTGGAPVIAEIARNQGALTVGIVTKPFAFEGTVRMQQALEGIAHLREAVDTLIIIPNQRLLEVVPPSTSMQEAFRIADNVLYDATRGIFEIISRHDQVNLDFADVRAVMKGMGEAMMGTGRAEGENRAVEAAKAAINSPLLENVDISGSRAVLVNVLGRDVGLQDTAAAMQHIQEAAGPGAHVIFGCGNDDEMEDTLQVTVIATGFQSIDGPAQGSFTSSVIEDPDTLLDKLVAQTGGPEPETSEEVAAEGIAEPATDPTTEPIAEPIAEPSTEPSAEPTEVPALEAAPAVDLPAAELDVQHDEFVQTKLVTTEPEVAPAAQLAPEPTADVEPAPLAEQVVLPEMPAQVRAEPAATAAARTDERFLKRMVASSGGPDVEAAPAMANRFLARVGVRPLGEVEVPAVQAAPAPVTRSVASGIGPENPGDDISAPAYTRKYMD